MIQKQIKLPISVAISVALQGIQVRFARSLVTVTGVMLGIAFLMSILTGQVIKHGVEEEEALRGEVNRMYNFLVAEMGPARGRNVGIVQIGTLTRPEERLIQRIASSLPENLRIATTAGVTPMRQLPANATQADLGNVGDDVHALLIMGSGNTASLDIPALIADARFPLVCFSRREFRVAEGGQVTPVILEREVPEDELRRMEEQAEQNKVRSIWIIVISLLVTVIGITNSMLMSVTERFREIGTMKCLGALSGFIRQLFLIESSLIGMVGALAGAIAGTLFSFFAYWLTYQWLVFQAINVPLLTVYFVGSIVVGVFLAIVAALYPAKFASNMLPAHALRSTI